MGSLDLLAPSYPTSRCVHQDIKTTQIQHTGDSHDFCPQPSVSENGTVVYLAVPVGTLKSFLAITSIPIPIY